MEFINQLLQKESLLGDKSFLDTDCIIEQSVWKSKLIEDKFKLYIQENLKIENINFLNFQIDLFNKFKITQELVPKKNIIENREYIEFNESFKDNEFAYLDWLEKKNCKKGFSSISKPLFNENYDLAMVRFEKICGPLCGGGVIVLYELKSKKWMQKVVIDNWIK
ncbi:hypothetical protein [Aquimarina sp. AD10]|uniref:hypothetical protein n=1 Tax=Aquimarina sp. AD10 TaxID=1714849 RepID=UPI0011C39184|nr:hypothetical protein [Aquimarina sp. AD10]